MALNQSAADIKLRFDLNNEQYSELESAFSYAFAIGAFAFGWVVDRRGVYFLYPTVVAFWSLSGFLSGFAPSFALLLACRFSLGLFESGNWPCGIVTTKRVFPPAQRSLGNAFFQGGTALGAIITPLVVLASYRHFGGESAWSAPFKIIGLLGFFWVGSWLLLMRRDWLIPPAAPVDDLVAPAAWYAELLGNRRYWLLILVIVAVNATWHSFRVWMPLLLQKEEGFSRESMNLFMSLYYGAAECGSLAVGFGTLYLARNGRSVHGSRLVAFFACGLLTLGSLLVPVVPNGLPLQIVLLLIGFGSLGLFPTYFSLSQEVSVRHQGKVTGSLGCINALVLGGLYKLQGELIDVVESYSQVIMFAGIPPLLAGLAVCLWWNRRLAPGEAPRETRQCRAARRGRHPHATDAREDN